MKKLALLLVAILGASTLVFAAPAMEKTMAPTKGVTAKVVHKKVVKVRKTSRKHKAKVVKPIAKPPVIK